MLLMMIYPFAADPLVTVSITILNTVGITIVLLFVLMWRRAASPPDTRATGEPVQNGRSANSRTTAYLQSGSGCSRVSPDGVVEGRNRRPGPVAQQHLGRPDILRDLAALTA